MSDIPREALRQQTARIRRAYAYAQPSYGGSAEDGAHRVIQREREFDEWLDALLAEHDAPAVAHTVHVTATPVAEDVAWCDECEEWVTAGAPEHVTPASVHVHDRDGQLDRSICGVCNDAYAECVGCGVYACGCDTPAPREPFIDGPSFGDYWPPDTPASEDAACWCAGRHPKCPGGSLCCCASEDAGPVLTEDERNR